jgi:copper chaperone CopZ
MKVIFKVEDMHCSACAMTLEGLEDDLPGVQRVCASYHKQQMEVEFDPAQVSQEQIVRAAAELGYMLKIG